LKEENVSPVSIVCERGDERIVRLLIENKVSLEAKDKSGKTPLMIACERRRNRIAILLIESGAEIETRDENGWTPLMFACKYGLYDVAQILVKRGAFVDAVDNRGSSAWSIALLSGNPQMKQFFIDHAKQSESTFDSEREKRERFINACKENDNEVVKNLIGEGLFVDERESNGETRLMIATRNGNEE